MLAKLFQEFHPIGAAPKHTVADTRSSQEERMETIYHLDGFDALGSLNTNFLSLSLRLALMSPWLPIVVENS